ncbi:N-acetyl-gamma-glutamyl-phosphate reductase [Chenggangzhangella methanolivorans]|uniref:N-acetyl-gamma-glutamyl-phosphate reductase n=1 Tax=Chenggangzhangella methanolivorans TaxID=1437009 RepID=A0A9E6RAQ1_9HYPH|nr:N-acetyl-gamma-glutamyl-phosphate reductase [Chenggangzhangella methanolivorans]QZN99888.1 N-acetyl-gamma-glutamyl-phosphate reductase [Chenggangzhangella methanolivorans]
MTDLLNVAILGASGYTGSELVRLLARHPKVALKALTADRKAGQAMADVFPQFAALDLPRLTTIAEVDLAAIDLVFCALPHGTTQQVIADLFAKKPSIKVVDLSADFRLADPEAYATWYGHPHQALELQKDAVFGVSELYRDQIKGAKLVANPGCHSTTSILPLVPLLRERLIEPDLISIVSATGMSGAGRAAKEEMLFSEVSEGVHAYGVGKHRHTAELDQEFDKAAGRTARATFTPLLIPMNRGIYATITATLAAGATAEALHAALEAAYYGEPFVKVLPFGKAPQSRHVRGSNNVQLGVVADRGPDRAIVVSTLDNLVKGASGQAVQNMNLVAGFEATEGLGQLAIFP